MTDEPNLDQDATPDHSAKGPASSVASELPPGVSANAQMFHAASYDDDGPQWHAWVSQHGPRPRELARLPDFNSGIDDANNEMIQGVERRKRVLIANASGPGGAPPPGHTAMPNQQPSWTANLQARVSAGGTGGSTAITRPQEQPPQPQPQTHHGVQESPDPAIEREVFDYAAKETEDAAAPGGRTARTEIGKSAIRNRIQILLSADVLSRLIDERLAALEGERPNSEEGQAAIAVMIAHYRDVAEKLTPFQGAILELSAGGNDDAVAQSTRSFGEAIQHWWDDCHVQICNTVFDKG